MISSADWVRKLREIADKLETNSAAIKSATFTTTEDADSFPSAKIELEFVTSK